MGVPMSAPKVLLEVALVSFLVLSLLVIPAAFAAVYLRKAGGK